MALELAPDERDVLVRVVEHVRGAVDGDEPLAALDEVDERLLLRGRDLQVVAVDHQPVVERELRRVERLGGRQDVRELDAAPGERRGEQREQRRRVVALRLVVAQEQNAKGPRLRYGGRGGARGRSRGLSRLGRRLRCHVGHRDAHTHAHGHEGPTLHQPVSDTAERTHSTTQSDKCSVKPAIQDARCGPNPSRNGAVRLYVGQSVIVHGHSRPEPTMSYEGRATSYELPPTGEL